MSLPGHAAASMRDGVRIKARGGLYPLRRPDRNMRPSASGLRAMAPSAFITGRTSRCLRGQALRSFRFRR